MCQPCRPRGHRSKGDGEMLLGDGLGFAGETGDGVQAATSAIPLHRHYSVELPRLLFTPLQWSMAEIGEIKRSVPMPAKVG